MHIHVANLYNDIFPIINEDFILTIEDDIGAPQNGLQKLHEQIVCPTKIGAIAGVYPLYQGANRVTASINKQTWDFDISFNSLKGEIIDVGFLDRQIKQFRHFLWFAHVAEQINVVLIITKQLCANIEQDFSVPVRSCLLHFFVR